MNLTLETQITAEVRARVANRDMFTAYDITKAVRAVAPGVNVRHNEVRDVVHGLFRADEMDGYDRTLQNLGGANGDAFVYHPFGSNSANYGAVNTAYAQPAQIAAPVKQIAASSDGDDSEDDQDTTKRQTAIDQRRLDRKGRLRIPAKMFRDAGIWPHDVVYVSTDPAGTITMSKQIGAGRAYVVDCYGNARMTLKTSAQQFRFCCQQGQVQALPS